jgi:hypothetical protein
MHAARVLRGFTVLGGPSYMTTPRPVSTRFVCKLYKLVLNFSSIHLESSLKLHVTKLILFVLYVLIWIHLVTVALHPQPILPALKPGLFILFDNSGPIARGFPRWHLVSTPSTRLLMLSLSHFCTSDKIGTIQRRLAWPLRKDDMIVREGTTFLCSKLVVHAWGF